MFSPVCLCESGCDVDLGFLLLEDSKSVARCVVFVCWWESPASAKMPVCWLFGGSCCEDCVSVTCLLIVCLGNSCAFCMVGAVV